MLLTLVQGRSMRKKIPLRPVCCQKKQRLPPGSVPNISDDRNGTRRAKPFNHLRMAAFGNSCPLRTNPGTA